MKITHLSLAALLLAGALSCKKSEKKPEAENPATPENPAEARKQILNEVAANVILASYADMAAKANTLYNNLVAFSGASTAANLTAAKTSWKDVRSAWEQSEGFLFGPVSVDNIDPRIDTWPIDFNRMDSVLASSDAFTSSYIDNLEESLKGFHPLEYLLFGQNGNKDETQFTSREKDLAVALALNIKTLSDQVKNSWDPAVSNNYTVKFTTAGSGSAIYATQRAVYEEVIDAMAGICDEVANGKIKEPFDAVDPLLEESPFAKNSIVDFTNNIKSVQNMYLGKYTSDGKGMEDLIKSGNLAMDGNIKTKIAAAITSLNNITMPFGQAISTTNGQRTQVQNAINAIGDLQAYLEGDVKTYLQTITN